MSEVPREVFAMLESSAGVVLDDGLRERRLVAIQGAIDVGEKARNAATWARAVGAMRPPPYSARSLALARGVVDSYATLVDTLNDSSHNRICDLGRLYPEVRDIPYGLLSSRNMSTLKTSPAHERAAEGAECERHSHEAEGSASSSHSSSQSSSPSS